MFMYSCLVTSSFSLYHYSTQNLDYTYIYYFASLALGLYTAAGIPVLLTCISLTADSHTHTQATFLLAST